MNLTQLKYTRSEAVPTGSLRIYTGILGQIGDIVMFTPTARRLHELFPTAIITFAVSSRYQSAGELIAGLPYIQRLFVTERYFENLSERLIAPWQAGWPVDLRGDDEAFEQRRHDIVLETRPRHKQVDWWRHRHQVAETADIVGVPGVVNLQTEISIPQGVPPVPEAEGKVVLHNDPAIDARKAWSWENVNQLATRIGRKLVVLLGNPGPPVPGCIDLRGRTTLAQAAKIIESAACFVGIDSGLMWIAGSLAAPVVGIYGNRYIPRPQAVQPVNRNALYLQADGPTDGVSVDDVYRALRQQLELRDRCLS